jgi:hypothetical protein
MRIIWLTASASAAIWAIGALPAHARTDIQDIPSLSESGGAAWRPCDGRSAQAGQAQTRPLRRTGEAAARRNPTPAQQKEGRACAPSEDDETCVRRRSGGTPDAALMRPRLVL